MDTASAHRPLRTFNMYIGADIADKIHAKWIQKAGSGCPCWRWFRPISITNSIIRDYSAYDLLYTTETAKVHYQVSVFY